MPLFVVERDLPGMSRDQLAAALRAAGEAAAQVSATGERVKYLRSLFIPSQARCLCLFEASAAEHVRAVNEAARVPFSAVLEVLDLPPRRE